MRLRPSSIVELALSATLVACTSSAHTPAPVDPATVARVKALRIVPASASMCPGKTMGASYVATLDDGTTQQLSPDAVERSAVGATASPRGAWAANDDPLLTMISGFKLHAQLRGNAGIIADTTIIPEYSCRPREFVQNVGDDRELVVRLSEFSTPFYPDLVFVSIEPDSSHATHVVLDPRVDGPGALVIDARGRTGTPGTAGQLGSSGAAPCTSGGRGGDGAPGQPGGNGGQVVIIAQKGASLLPGFLSVRAPGGRGGQGGAAGAGGRANFTLIDGMQCEAINGQNGRAGANGPDGSEGTSRIALLPIDDLWQDSVDWQRADRRDLLTALIHGTAVHR